MENQDMDNVRPVVECPVCLEVKHDTHYFSCVVGHHVCSPCKNKISQCPCCRSGFGNPPTRSFAVEAIIEKLEASDWEAPCKEATNGCGFRGMRTDLLMHQVTCEYRCIVPCPVGVCAEIVDARDIVGHIRESHNGFPTYEENRLILPQHPLDPRALLVYDYDDETFVLRFKKEHNAYFFWVVVLGNRILAEKYKVTIYHGAYGLLRCPVSEMDLKEEVILSDKKRFVQEKVYTWAAQEIKEIKYVISKV